VGRNDAACFPSMLLVPYYLFLFVCLIFFVSGDIIFCFFFFFHLLLSDCAREHSFPFLSLGVFFFFEWYRDRYLVLYMYSLIFLPFLLCPQLSLSDVSVACVLGVCEIWDYRSVRYLPIFFFYTYIIFC
jgi:hypothetical protein